MMPVSTRLRANLRTNEPDLRAEILHKDPHQGELPTVEIGVQESLIEPHPDKDLDFSHSILWSTKFFWVFHNICTNVY